MDYYGLMVQILCLSAVPLAAALLLVASAGSVHAKEPARVRGQSKVATDALANPKAELDARLFYEIFLGELSTRSGDPGTGYALMLEAARQSGDSQLYQRAADIALQSRSGEYALAAARAWREAHPESRDANRYVLQILIALNRIGETPELLKRELAQSSERSRISSIQALPQIYGRASDKPLAAAVVEQALENELRDASFAPIAWTTVGRLRLAAGNKPGALAAAQKAQEFDEHYDRAAILAMDLMAEGVPQAEPLVTRYLHEKGSPPEMRMLYAKALLGLQRFTDASRQVDEAIQANPEMAEAWLLKAMLQYQNQQLAQAEAALQRFMDIAQRPGGVPAIDIRQRIMAQAYELHSRIAEKRGDYAAAEAWLARMESTEDLLSTQSRRALLMARQGKLAQARALIRDLPARNPDEVRMRLLAEVQLLRELQLYEDALQTQAEAVALSPDDNDLVYDEAMLAEKAGKPELMERLLRQIVARQPDYHAAYNALGYYFADRGERLQEARALITKALEYAPGDPFITDSLAWVEFRMGNLTEALRLLDMAFKARPDPEIAAHLGEVLWSLGQQERAKSIWQEGMRLNPDNETLRATLKRLGAQL